MQRRRAFVDESALPGRPERAGDLIVAAGPEANLLISLLL